MLYMLTITMLLKTVYLLVTKLVVISQILLPSAVTCRPSLFVPILSHWFGNLVVFPIHVLRSSIRGLLIHAVPCGTTKRMLWGAIALMFDVNALVFEGLDLYWSIHEDCRSGQRSKTKVYKSVVTWRAFSNAGIFRFSFQDFTGMTYHQLHCDLGSSSPIHYYSLYEAGGILGYSLVFVVAYQNLMKSLVVKVVSVSLVYSDSCC